MDVDDAVEPSGDTPRGVTECHVCGATMRRSGSQRSMTVSGMTICKDCYERRPQ